VHRLIREVFTTQVAPLYSEEGVCSFLDYIDPDELARRAGRDHELIAAEDTRTGDILGVAEVRRCTHIALLFVSAEVQREGVGRRLLEQVCLRCRSRGRRILTVNAAPNAVSAYEHLGFTSQGPEREESGIRSVPMIRAVDESP
jgi:GNAT superfamily N-acetyltransferase